MAEKKPVSRNKTRVFRKSAAELITLKAKILRLLKDYGVSEVARRVGVNKAYVSNVKHNILLKNVGTLSLENLSLRHANNKLCARCGDPAIFFCKSFRCIKCEIRYLESIGMLKILKYEDMEE